MIRGSRLGWGHRLTAAIAVIFLLLGIGGCGDLKGDIPADIVATAVTQQAQQEQLALWQQLSAATDTAPRLSVNHVKVRHVRQVKVATALAYEVAGTYRYRLQYADRSPVKQSRVPFSLIVQRPSAAEPWQLLQTDGPFEGGQSWRWWPLTDQPDEADETSPTA
ncbi:MAG: hypothetical protein ACFB0G_07430 [Leptolyngbyaceae cyanobacterium]